MELRERWNSGTVEHLNVSSECVFSKLLTSNDIAMFSVMSPIVTTVIWQTETNYRFNRFPQSRQNVIGRGNSARLGKTHKHGPPRKATPFAFSRKQVVFLDKW